MALLWPLSGLAAGVGEGRLAGIVLPGIVAASPEEAGFALETAQTTVFAVGTGEGFFRAGEWLNGGVSSEYRQLRVQRLVVMCDHRAVSRLALGDGVEVVFHVTGVGNLQKIETAA